MQHYSGLPAKVHSEHGAVDFGELANGKEMQIVAKKKSPFDNVLCLIQNDIILILCFYSVAQLNIFLKLINKYEGDCE